MRVLGIDTGYAITGWAIMDKDIRHTNGIKLIDFGVFVTKPDISISARLHKINEHLDELIDKYKPEHMAVEELFYFKNKKTVINVSQARGVILLTGEKRGLSIFGYTPLEVKTSVTGYGRADKSQVQKMVAMITGLKEIPKPDDAADAIAIAFCHISSIRYIN